jgi:hypothetical protein
MGQTIQTLAKKSLPGKPVFNNRFVVEVCEKIHLHYRNLRIVFDITDFIKFAECIKKTMLRWVARGQPLPDKKKHIELCRSQVAKKDDSDTVQINLNKNLYKVVKDRIFSEGAEIDSDQYIHLKIRDLRVELSINEFLIIADAFREADKKFKNSDPHTLLQKT